MWIGAGLAVLSAFTAFLLIEETHHVSSSRQTRDDQYRANASSE